MVRAIMHGCNGAMGQVISGIAAKDEEISIVAGIDMRTEQKNDYPVFASLNECKVEADVVIDFPMQQLSMNFSTGVQRRKCRLFCVRQDFLRYSWQR